jgi:hypothetical protein
MISVIDKFRSTLVQRNHLIEICNSVIDEKSCNKAVEISKTMTVLEFNRHDRFDVKKWLDDHLQDVINSNIESTRWKLEFLIYRIGIYPNRERILTNCTSKEGFKLLLDAQKRRMIKSETLKDTIKILNDEYRDAYMSAIKINVVSKEATLALFEYFVSDVDAPQIDVSTLDWIYCMVCKFGSFDLIIERVSYMVNHDAWVLLTTLIENLATELDCSKYRKVIKLRQQLRCNKSYFSDTRFSIDLNPWIFAYRLNEYSYTEDYEKVLNRILKRKNEAQVQKIEQILSSLFTINYLYRSGIAINSLSTESESDSDSCLMILGEYIDNLESLDKWIKDLRLAHDEMIEQLHYSIESKDLVHLSLSYLIGQP